MESKKLYCSAELSNILGIQRENIDSWGHDKKVKRHFVPFSHLYHYDKDEVEKYIARSRFKERIIRNSSFYGNQDNDQYHQQEVTEQKKATLQDVKESVQEALCRINLIEENK